LGPPTFIEKLTVAQPAKNSFHPTQPLDPILKHFNSVQTLTRYFSNIHINTPYSKVVSSLEVFRIKYALQLIKVKVKV